MAAGRNGRWEGCISSSFVSLFIGMWATAARNPRLCVPPYSTHGTRLAFDPTSSTIQSIHHRHRYPFRPRGLRVRGLVPIRARIIMRIHRIQFNLSHWPISSTIRFSDFCPVTLNALPPARSGNASIDSKRIDRCALLEHSNPSNRSPFPG